MKAKYIHLKETPSTNTYMSGVASVLPSGTVIYTTNQSQGRGQRGNYWESEPDKNVTFSLLVRETGLEPQRQFFISEAVSIAIVKALSAYGEDFSIKWPNDIYYGDKKICGILIEHSISGNKIDYSIIGVGLNVNQIKFQSDAPNPVSLAQIVEGDLDVEDVLHEVVESIGSMLNFDEDALGDLHQQYLDMLYRYDQGMHNFMLPDGTEMMATIRDVKPSGMLVLESAEGITKEYAFKEVAFVI